MNSGKSKAAQDAVTPSPWRIYSLMAVVTLIILGTITYTLFMGNRINAKYAPLLDATSKIRLKATQAHLWFEEVISDDPSIKVAEVLGLVDQADWYANAILEGGSNSEGVFLPIKNHGIEKHIRLARKDLAELKKLTNQRFKMGKAAGIGSDMEQEYDAVFENFLERANLAEKLIQLSMRADLDRFRFSQVFLMAACLIISVMVGALFHRLDRRRAEAVALARKEELKAKKSEKWLYTSLESMADAVITTDPEGKIAYMNPVAVSITGWNQADAIGMEIFEVFKLAREETHESLESPVTEVLRGGVVTELANHIVLIAKNDMQIPVAASGAPIRDDQEQLLGVILVFRDISEQRRAEQILKESEGRYRHLVEHAPTGIYEIDFINLKLTSANDAMCRFTGYTKEEFLSINPLELLTEKSRKIYLERMSKAFAGETVSETVELEIKVKDGRKFWTLLNTRYRYADGKPVGATVVAQDITERKRIEEDLRQSEERFRELAELLPETIYEIDLQGNLTFVNRKAFDHFGYTQDDLDKGISLFDMIISRDRNRAMENAKKIMGGENIGLVEYTALRKDGSTFPALFHSNTIHHDGDSGGMRGFIIDITETKRLENQFQQTQKMEAIGTLAGGIAHDFNNILASIIGYTELTMYSVDKGTTLYDNLKEIFRAGERAKNLVKQILTFSRQADQERRPVQISLIVKETLKFLRASLPTTILIRPDIQSDSLVLADPTQIHQVLMNLCTNAGHAMRQKGGVLEVKVTDIELDAGFAERHPELKAGSYLQILVSDTGHGIPADILDRIFDPFFTTKKQGEGTGMGLAVVHGIVGSYGGMIMASSEPGKGSTFTVYLPVVETYREMEIESEESIPTGMGRILFVDDEPALADIGKQMLESLGYKVTTRTSSLEALDLFKAKADNFDLVITDMTMPHMTGDNLAMELMRIKPEIPVILCTGYSARINHEQASAMGIRAFVFKPVLKREIAESIHKVLNDQKS